MLAGNDVINQFSIPSVAGMQCWNKALWLDVESHMSSFNQLDCFIFALFNYVMQKSVYEISSYTNTVTMQNNCCPLFCTAEVEFLHKLSCGDYNGSDWLKTMKWL